MEEKEIYFRASSIGSLMVEAKGNTFTEANAIEIEDLLYELENGVNRNGNKVKWTDNKVEKLNNLIAKRDSPPELSETAKREVEKIWLLNEKGFVKELNNKYIMKGLFQEEDGIGLISELDDVFYVKNTERINKGNITGECDIRHIFKTFDELPQWRKDIDDGNTKFPLKVIKDIKSCYDAQTFMNSEICVIYDAQGRTYLHLYDFDEFHLEFTLTDLPEHLLESEIWKIRNKYGIMDVDTPEAKPIIDQIKRNFIYSTNPAYTLEERRKVFVVKRDLDFEKKLLEKVSLALDYYKKISLNQV